MATSSGQLWLLAAYETGGKLVGLAPMYQHRAQHRRAWAAQRLESIGSTFRAGSDVFSEDLDFVIDDRYVDAFLPALAEHLMRNSDWTDLVVSNTRADSFAARLIREHLSDTCYVRKVDQLTAYASALPDDFTVYLSGLRSTTRRKMWNHRKKLPAARLVYCEPADTEAFFDEMDRYHEARWGKAHFVGAYREFYREFGAKIAPYGEIKMSRLVHEGCSLSLMYNVRIGDTEYNIQSGFNPSQAGVSPGYLHFGYCMEDACQAGVQYFDFLAGAGRSREYKQDFVTAQKSLVTFQSIRARPLAWFYQKYDSRFLATMGVMGSYVTHFPETHAVLANVCDVI